MREHTFTGGQLLRGVRRWTCVRCGFDAGFFVSKPYHQGIFAPKDRDCNAVLVRKVQES
jgi:hypothetical protein